MDTRYNFEIDNSWMKPLLPTIELSNNIMRSLLPAIEHLVNIQVPNILELVDSDLFLIVNGLAEHVQDYLSPIIENLLRIEESYRAMIEDWSAIDICSCFDLTLEIEPLIDEVVIETNQSRAPPKLDTLELNYLMYRHYLLKAYFFVGSLLLEDSLLPIVKWFLGVQ